MLPSGVDRGGVKITVSDPPSSRFDSRCELMLDVAFQTLSSDPELRLCEGLRLIDATRTAVARLAPASLDYFDEAIMPRMREVLMNRFGVVDPPEQTVN